MASFSITTVEGRVEYALALSGTFNSLFIFEEPVVTQPLKKIGYIWFFYKDAAPRNTLIMCQRGVVYAPGTQFPLIPANVASNKQCRLVARWDVPGITLQVVY